MEFEKVIKERFSVRNFLNKEIDDITLNKIYEAGILAPTAKNAQPQRIYVLKSKEALEKIKGITRCYYDAPLVFICCYDKNESWKNKYSLEDSGVEDTSISCTHMMLEAWNLGVGSCWVNMYNSFDIKREFNLPDNIVTVCLLLLGYPSGDAKPIPMHYEKKTKEELFFEL